MMDEFVNAASKKILIVFIVEPFLNELSIVIETVNLKGYIKKETPQRMFYPSISSFAGDLLMAEALGAFLFQIPFTREEENDHVDNSLRLSLPVVSQKPC